MVIWNLHELKYSDIKSLYPSIFFFPPFSSCFLYLANNNSTRGNTPCGSLRRAEFSKPCSLKKHLFEQRNTNQNILPLLAESHIQSSPGLCLRKSFSGTQNALRLNAHLKFVRSTNVVKSETAVSNETGIIIILR